MSAVLTVPPPPPQSADEVNHWQQQQQGHRHLEHRNTDGTAAVEEADGVDERYFDVFWPEHDECLNDEIEETVIVPDDGVTTTYTRTRPVYGPCNTTRFPVCDPDTQLICYNRRPRQDKFYRDIRQPYFFIDYRTVFCYPNTWGGCSSCSPGRLCLSENRCILEDIYYTDCDKWI
jgi:hypothetical protein